MRCSEDDRGLFVEVRYFQLTSLEIPDELNQRYLQALILKEASQTEKLKQEAQIIRKETDAMVLYTNTTYSVKLTHFLLRIKMKKWIYEFYEWMNEWIMDIQ